MILEVQEVAKPYRRSYLRTKVIAVGLAVFTIILLIAACFLLWAGDFLLQIALQLNWNLFKNIWQIFSIIVIMAIATLTTGLVDQLKTRLSRTSEQKFKLKIILLLIFLATTATFLVLLYYVILQNLLLNSAIETTLAKLLIDIWRLLGFPIALGMVAIAFSLIYRYGASKRIKNTPILPGAVLAAVSWAIVSLLFRFYVTHIGIYSKLYGAVGTAVVLMLWLYLSSLVMLIAEQINVLLGEAALIQSHNRRF